MKMMPSRRLRMGERIPDSPASCPRCSAWVERSHATHRQTDALPILSWGAAVDDATLDQAVNLARLPFAFHHIALMADAHVGFGMPIGGVLATRGEVIPHAVGLDIGCGMRAWPTNIPAERHRAGQARDAPRRDALRAHRLPPPQAVAGRAHAICSTAVPDVPVLRAEAEKAEYQVGSLGGGNHFIELQADEARHDVGDGPLGVAQRRQADGGALRPRRAGRERAHQARRCRRSGGSRTWPRTAPRAASTSR